MFSNLFDLFIFDISKNVGFFKQTVTLPNKPNSYYRIPYCSITFVNILRKKAFSLPIGLYFI